MAPASGGTLPGPWHKESDLPMHDHRSEDARAQRAVLSLILDEHPALLATSEIEREIGSDDAVARAMRDLTGIGLLRREGASVLPTRAALHFDRLAA
jgi:hypothetical protein